MPYQVKITTDDRGRLRELQEMDLDLKYRGARQVLETEFSVPGILSFEEIERVRGRSFRVDVTADLDLVAPERLAEVSRTNRFADARALEEFEDRSVLGYMTSAEVDSAINALAAAHPGTVT